MKDRLINAIGGEGFVSITAVSSRATVERARQIHHTTPLATAALGRVLTAASIMGSWLKTEKASVTVQFSGGGPIGSILAVSDSLGNPRGYVHNPAAELPKRPDGKLNVGEAVGRDGLLTVIRDLGMREPYIGKVRLVSGEIAEDIAAYLFHSEQKPAACALGVLVDVDLTVKAAGGYIITMLPGAPEDLAVQTENRVRSCEDVTTLLDAGMSPEELIGYLLPDYGMRILSAEDIAYTCSCSKERVLRALSCLDENALKETEGPLEVVCQFCDKIYKIPQEE